MNDKIITESFTVQNFDKFENITTTEWNFPQIDNILGQNNWNRKGKKVLETFDLTLRRSKSTESDSLFLDYDWFGDDLFFFNSGNLIVNLGGTENIKLFADDEDDRKHLNQGWEMTGFYYLSKDELKKICSASNLSVRLSEARYSFELEGNGLLKFQFMCRSFYSDVFDDHSHDLWINSIITAKSESKSSAGCFIATAVMDDYNHPIVLDLRKFRDNWLINRAWGKEFTNWYYINGPKAAKRIERSNMLKKITYFLLVKPLHFIIKNTFKYNDEIR